MRQERVRTASIDDKLQDLIAKSDVIVQLLQGPVGHAGRAKGKSRRQPDRNAGRARVYCWELERSASGHSGDGPQDHQLREPDRLEQDAAKRTKLETELAALNSSYNEMVQDEQVKLAKSQTLERYIEKGKTWIDSLQNQAATQMVLINKLQTDTKQRVVLYDALTKSLKTAQQQDVAHRINEIGVQTDQEAQSAMAGIGAATNQADGRDDGSA